MHTVWGSAAGQVTLPLACAQMVATRLPTEDTDMADVDKQHVAKGEADSPRESPVASKLRKFAPVLGFLAGLVVATAILVPVLLTVTRQDSSTSGQGTTDKAPSAQSGQVAPGQPAPGQPAPAVSSSSSARTYYIQAELVNWQYQPFAKDLCPTSAGKPEKDGSKESRRKAVFRQYTDSTFQTRVERGELDQHLGILGPMLHAEAGSSLTIVFRNNATLPLNMEPSGALYAAAAPVNPGEQTTYVWAVPEEAAPPAGARQSSTMYMYRSSVHTIQDLFAGLYGPIIVTRKGEADADGRPSGVDREFVAVLQIMDETNALHTALSSTRPDAANGPTPAEEDKLYVINGMVNCNIQGFNISHGQKGRFYVAALGNEADVHVMHWHGVTFDMNGRNVDQVILLAGVTHTLDFEADNPGAWIMHCHVNDHLKNGMKAHLTISDGPLPQMPGTVRQYYVAAEVVEWDYAPSGRELCSGVPEPFSEEAKVFLEPGPDRIGRKYLKARYVEYTDDTFTTRKPITPEQEHLGIQGPVLRAEVGDTIQVLFKNKMNVNHPATMHPHGVQYAKDAEGALYGDFTSGAMKADDGVMPNKTHTYKWLVPERTGPGPADPNSIVWIYHSHNNEMSETNAGLYGAIVVYRQGELRESAGGGLPVGVDRETFMVFTVTDESQSFLFDRNAARYLRSVLQTPGGDEPELFADGDFMESNLMHNINGYMYCNLPGLNFTQGGSTRFYLMAYGNEVDMHTPYMFSSRFSVGGFQRQSMQLLPGSMIQADSAMMVPGDYPIVCRVADHITAGMEALMRVPDEGKLSTEVSGPTRSYFIQSEELQWDFTPLGYDGCSGGAFSEDALVFVNTTATTLGSRYRKAVFRGYTDSTFTTRTPAPAFHGLLGPVLRAEVGDKLEITLRNAATFNVSLQLAGGLWPLDQDSNPTDPVAPKGSKTYSFVVPEAAGPGLDSVTGLAAYMYLSGQEEVASGYAGLVGLLLVGAKDTFTGPEGRTKGVDAELPLLFSVMDENQSPFLDANIDLQRTAAKLRFIDTSSEDFEESNKMHGINGFMYCNMPQPAVAPNSKSLVVLMGLGTEVDMHGPVFTGQTLQVDGQPVWAPTLMPASVQVGVLTSSSQTGAWELFCMVSDHYAAGMRAKLAVTPTQPSTISNGRRLKL